MYEIARRPELQGFSLTRALTPPKALRDLIASQVGTVLRGTQVSIPTDSGTVSFDLSNPANWAAIKRALMGIKISRSPAAPEGPAGPASFVDSIPGGWLTVGLGGFLLMKALAGRRG